MKKKDFLKTLGPDPYSYVFGRGNPSLYHKVVCAI